MNNSILKEYGFTAIILLAIGAFTLVMVNVYHLPDHSIGDMSIFLGIFYWYKWFMARRKPEEMKKMQAQNDERQIFIRSKVAEKSFMVTMFCLIIVAYSGIGQIFTMSVEKFAGDMFMFLITIAAILYFLYRERT
jgi:hypothetical protein